MQNYLPVWNAEGYPQVIIMDTGEAVQAFKHALPEVDAEALCEEVIQEVFHLLKQGSTTPYIAITEFLLEMKDAFQWDFNDALLARFWLEAQNLSFHLLEELHKLRIDSPATNPWQYYSYHSLWLDNVVLARNSQYLM